MICGVPRTLLLDGRPTSLSESDTGSGGTAYLMDVQGHPELLLKWYKRPMSAGRAQRLRWAIEHGRTPAGSTDNRVCWPLELVGDGKRVRGFVMRRAAPGSVELSWLATRVHREQRGIPHDVDVRLRVVAEAAKTIADLHRDGWIVCDLRRANMMVALGSFPRVQLVDSDSFHRVGSSLGGEHAPGYAAPELVDSSAAPTQEADRWAFAVLVHELLADAQHPYQRPGAESLSDAVRLGPCDPVMLERHPGPIAGMLRAALCEGHNDPALRPELGDWAAVLTAELDVTFVAG